MSKTTITVEITNIPTNALDDIWKSSIKDARKSLGVPVEKSNSININFESISNQDTEIASELIASIITAHVIQTADTILNPQQ